jgi:hypothetical protein
MMWKDIVDVVQGLGVTAASAAAVYGVVSWRRELKGRKEYELAEEALALFYEARDKIEAIRSPLSYEGEGKALLAAVPGTSEDSQVPHEVRVFFERYARCETLFSRLQALYYRFMAVFGTEKAVAFVRFRKLLAKVRAAARMLARLAAARQREAQDYVEKERDIIWGGADDDPIATEMDGIVRDIESTCEGVLRGGSKVPQTSCPLVRGLRRLGAYLKQESR